MDVLLVDVGFGTCNVILTGSGEAIVIDAGERPKEVLAVLHYFSVRRIRHFIISHWHDDHVGGAPGVLRAYPERIGTIWFPSDARFKRTRFWKALVAESEAGRLQYNQIEALMVGGGGTRQIWGSGVYDADLTIVSPCFMEMNRGIAAGNPNATCGILILRVGGRYIVFAGDATLAQWQEVVKRVPVPIRAEALAVPHHAGIMWPDRWTPAQVQTALGKLYTKVVRPKIAVISAGTRPGTKHPREDVVAALRKAHAAVMCTQMTERCTSDLEGTRKLQTALPVVAPGRSSPKPTKTHGKANHVACAGSIIVELLSRPAKTIAHGL
jgi:beta-lactamase superfamily II metal-dependent hydrolase